MVGKLGLEALMSRANILFTSGYHFSGHLETEKLENSYYAVTEKIAKFQHELEFMSQNDFNWKPKNGRGTEVFKIKSENLVESFTDVSADSYRYLEKGGNSPMALVIIESADNGEFILAQICNHIYVDARSGETIFNMVVEHYNSLLNQNETARQKILDLVNEMRTADSAEIYQLLTNDKHQHDHNLEKLGTYPIADEGEYAVKIETLPTHLETYVTKRRKPIIQNFNIKKLVSHCREKYPEVTKNSAFCAVLSKALYNINVRHKGLNENHIVSGKMLSDLLAPEQREKFTGNYIAFVPFTVDGEINIDDMSDVIHKRIREFKETKLDLSLFKLVEDYSQQGLMGKSNEDLSYIVTNWTNFTFLHEKNFLTNCQSIRHLSGVNIEPKCTVGGALVNRPVMVLSMSANDELCLSFFPSLRSDDETQQIADEVERIMSQF